MQGVAFLALLAGAASAHVTPFAKVVKLIEGLQTEVEDEGKAEATTYGKFACFCKTTTKKKSDSVTRGSDKINSLSADIAEDTATKGEHATDLGERKVKQEKLSADLDAETARHAKEKATYEVEAADLMKAISSLKSAVKAMKESKPAAASLVEVTQSVALALAPFAASGKSSGLARKAMALVQQQAQQRVDPSDPRYAFHSTDIVELCEKLFTDFKGQKTDLDKEWGKTDKACIATKASLNGEMKSNKRAMAQAEKDIERLSKKIAQDRGSLVLADGDLKDDQLYLKDLTARCEERANDYDQRSQMRSDELKAFSAALGVLTKDVSSADAEANSRALLLQRAKSNPKKHLALLEGASVSRHGKNLLAQSRADASEDLSLEAKKDSCPVHAPKGRSPHGQLDHCRLGIAFCS